MYIKYFHNHLYYEKLSSVTLYSYKTCGLSRGNCRLGKPPGKVMSSFSSCTGNHDLKWQFVHHQVLSWHSGLWHWLLQLWSWHALCLSSSWPHPTWTFLLAAKPLSFFSSRANHPLLFLQLHLRLCLPPVSFFNDPTNLLLPFFIACMG